MQTIKIQVPNEGCVKSPVNVHLESTELEGPDSNTGHKASQTSIIMFDSTFGQAQVNNLTTGCPSLMDPD